MGQMHRRRFVSLAVAGVALPVLAACASPPAPSPTAAPPKPVEQPTAAVKPAAKPTEPVAKPAPAAPKPTAAPVQRQVVKWKHATTGPSYGWVIQKMALEKGFFKEEGIDLEYVTLNTDATINKGLLAGEVDSGESGLSSVLVAAASGGSVKTLGAWLHRLNHDLMVRSHINKVSDLEGRNVAITSQGGLPHVVMLAVFEKHNVDPNKVNFVSLSLANETHVQALIAGTVDSGVASAELRLIIKGYPDVKVLTPFADEIPDYVRTVYIVSNQTHAQKKDVLERLLRAYGRGVKHALTNKEDAVNLGLKLTSQSREVMEFSFDLWKEKGWANPSGVIPMSSVQWMQDLNVRVKLQESKVDLAKEMDFSIAQKVAKELGL